MGTARHGTPLRAGIKAAVHVLAVAIGVFLLSIPVFAQATTGSITGIVTDQTGGVIAGATVTVTSVQQGTTRTLTTDKSGAYFAPNLTPGTYIVRAEAKNFRPLVRQGVAVELGAQVKVDLTLQPGASSQTITVTGAVPIIQTTNAQLGGTIQNTVIANLPLNGRNFENLLTLRPGVTIYPGGSGWSQSTNGIRPHDNVYYVDGVNSTDPWMAQSVMNAVMAAGDAGTILPVDAIDTFRTIQNPPAEYGWKPGSVVNVGIKSGTNAFHGTAYAYGRDGNWDASNFFTPGVTTPLQLEQFGATIGGPIKKDKLFFFLNFEEQRYTVGNPVVHNSPITTSGVFDSNFDANNALEGGNPNPSNLISACQQAVSDGALTALSAQLAGLTGPGSDTPCSPISGVYPGFFPVNNGTNGVSYATSLPSNNRIDSGLAKIDYHINDKNILSGMYFISPGDGTLVDTPGLQVSPQWLTNQYARSQVGSVSWTFTPNSNWVNELRVGYSHYYQTFLSVDANNNPANYSYNGNTYNFYTGQTNSAYYGLPEMIFQGGYSFMFGLNWPKTVGPDATTQISDHISYLHGNHTFMFGFDYLNDLSTNNVTQYTKGYLRFSNLTNYFEGLPNRARFAAGNFLRHMYSNNIGLFLQDSWRVKPRVTVNLGVRYEVDGVMHETDNLMGNFDPVQGLVQVGNGLTSAYNGDHNNFAPRVGVAWDIRGNGRSVLRAGASIMYEQFSYDTFNGIGNLVGLRTIPTGANLYVNGQQLPSPGSINAGAVFYSGSGLTSTSDPGAVPYQWANNGPNTPVFSATPACGDGQPVEGVPVTPQPCTIMAVNRNIRNPYVESWMLDFQQAITNNLSIDIGYVGNHGVKLLGITDLNQPPIGAGWGSATTPDTPLYNCLNSTNYVDCGAGNNPGGPSGNLEQAARPFNAQFPYIGYINYMSNVGKSSYNGLQVTVTQRTSHGLSFVAGYTYSHSLDTSSDNWGAAMVAPITTVQSLYGNSVFDVKNRFTFSTTYDLPGIKTPGQILEGWSLDSIVTLQSGQPWGVNDTSTDFSGTGEIYGLQTNGETWNFFGNTSAFNSNASVLANQGIPYFPGTTNSACLSQATSLGTAAVASLTNLGCYAVGNSVMIPAAYGTVGNLGRNTFRGFPFYNWDLSITKSFKVTERFSAAFRADFFNILNHPNIANVFGGPGGDNTNTDPTANGPFGFRPLTPDVLASNSVLGAGGPRAIQLGLKLRF